MPSVQFAQGIQGGGLVIQQVLNIQADHPNTFEIPIPAGVAGTLTTRTDNDTGIVTVASGHGITTSDVIDLYDSAGVIIRKDMTVTATGSTTISIDAGSGSNLPSVSGAVVVAKQTLVNTAIDGDAIQFIAVCLEIPGTQTTKGRAIFEESDDTDVVELTLTANQPLSWNVAGGQTNDFAGDPIAKCRASNGNTTAGTLKILSMEDSTP